MCQEFLRKAWDAKEKEDYAAAEANYLACLECDPENAEALRELGIMSWAMFKKTPEAIALIEKSLRSKDCAEGHFYLAMVNQTHDRARSLDEFQKAIEAYKTEGNPMGLLGLAHCYYANLLVREDKLLDAEEHFLEALRVDPDNEAIQRNNAHFQNFLREIGQHPSLSSE